MPAALLLDLLRHGAAAPAGTGGDRERALTPSGRGALERLGARIVAEGARHERVLASPLRRALESAEAVLRARTDPAPIETLDELSPDSSPLKLIEALRRALVPPQGHLLLVGHQPLLGQVALVLTGAEAGFAPGTLVRIQCPQGLVPGTGRILTAFHVQDSA